MNAYVSKDSSLMAGRNGINYWFLPLLSLLYFFAIRSTTGFRSDHLVFVLLVNGLYFASGTTRRFIYGFSIFAVYWVLFDSMKAWPNFNFAPVHIQDLFELEKSLFGIHSNGEILIPSAYLAAHATPAADLLTSLFYLCWVPVPLGFAGYLFATDKKNFLHYSLAFVVMNIVGFVIYYTHPAAAPWYVEQHGFAFDPAVKSNAAGLLRTDRLLGFGLFEGIYSKGSNVFAALPSLHSAYPLAGVYYSLRQPRRWITVAFVIVTVGIWFAAVYLSHHYILDVLAGIACGITGIALCEWLLRNGAVKRWLSAWVKLMQKEPIGSRD